MKLPVCVLAGGRVLAQKFSSPYTQRFAKSNLSSAMERGDRMRSFQKLAGSIATILLLVLVQFLTGCGGGGSSSSSVSVGSITVSPAIASLNFGDTLQFTATALDTNKNPISPIFTFSSNNPNVAGISSAGLACGGRWDSGFVNCTGGPVGVVQITASAGGVTSPPVKVFVHQRVDAVTITPASVNCLSKGGQQTFTATALNNVLGDITSTVGQFNWQGVDPSVAVLNPSINGLGLNQAIATAITPGKTGVFASISGVNSVPSPFVVCPVQSISLTINNVVGQTSATIQVSNTTKITPTVTDSLGATIAPALTYTSSLPAVATVGPAGLVTGANPGTTTVIASCTPPGCNTNLNPVYPSNVTTVTVTGNIPALNVWVASSGCTGHQGCTTSLVPISTPPDSLGTAVSLPSYPNSLVFDLQGKKAYLGSPPGLLIVDTSVSPPTVNLQASVKGKVLAVSNDGTKVLVSDTTTQPNDTFIFNTTTAIRTDVNVGGTSAADFSPDGLKAFMVNGNLSSPPPLPDLTIFSPVFAQQNLALDSGSNPLDVSFLPTGGYAYVAGGAPSAIAVRATCDTSSLPNYLDTISTAGTPTLIRALPNGTKVVAVLASNPPAIEVLTPTLGPSAPCPQSISDATSPTVALGSQSFTPIQMLVAPDSSKVYVLPKELPEIFVFDVASGTVSAIPLAGGALPLRAIIRPENNLIYVGASDGKLHKLRVSTQADEKQIGGLNVCSVACNPEFVALQP